MKNLFLSLWILFSLSVSAQVTGNLTVSVVDVNGLPAPGLVGIVEIYDQNQQPWIQASVTTDAQGMINMTQSLPNVGFWVLGIWDNCQSINLPPSIVRIYNFSPNIPNSYNVNDTLTAQCTVPNCNFPVFAMANGSLPFSYDFSSGYAGGSNSFYLWDFGDGSADTGQFVTHNYANPGVYNYCLTVDSCYVCDVVVVGGAPSGNLIAEGYVLGNGAPNNPWANVDLFVQIDNSFHLVTTDANGHYYAILPSMGNSGIMQASIETCTPSGQSFFEYGNLFNYDVSTGNTYLHDTLNISCYNGGPSNNGRILVTGYVLGNGGANNPWPNADVLILVDTTVYTLTTDANGYYQDSLPVINPIGLVIASITDCNGNLILGNVDVYNLLNGMVIVHDTVSASCVPSGSGSGNCQAEFIVDTVNSFNGQVVLWNVSLANPLGQTTWLWDFGDGSFSNSPFPTHQYTQPGMYAVCLTVNTIDPSGAACTSVYCDSLGVDANGNLIYKGQNTGFTLVVLDPSTIGQDENVLTELNVYPNPARSEVRFGGLTQAADYRLLDTYGRLLQTGTVAAGETLNLPTLSQGVYLLDVVSDGKRAQVRLLID